MTEKQEQENFKKAKRFVENIQTKIENGEGINHELEILKELYRYIMKTKTNDNQIVKFIESVLPDFEEYHQKRENEVAQRIEESKEKKHKQSKITIYKDLWEKQNIFYKLTHQKEDPKKIEFEQVESTFLENRIEKLSSKQK